MGDIPLMLRPGSFVGNGTERVVVSQLHRSPGVCFEKMKHASGKDLYSFKIIADHGSWLEVQYDSSDLMYIYLDRKHRRRKFLISTFLRAFGLKDDRAILDLVYRCFFLQTSPCRRLDLDAKKRYRVQPLFGDPQGAPADSESDMIDPEGNNLPHWLGVRDVPIKELKAMDLSDLTKVYTAEVILDPQDKDMELVENLSSLTPRALDAAEAAGIKTIACVDTAGLGDTFIRCIQREYKENNGKMFTPDDARKDIYRKIRPTDQPTDKNAQILFTHTFEDMHHYDLGRVGRFRMMKRLYQSPMRELDFLISETEVDSRKKFGQASPAMLKNEWEYVHSLVMQFKGNEFGKMDDELVLKTFFSSSENLYQMLFPGCGNLVHNGMESSVKRSVAKFLRESKPASVAKSAGGVLGEFVKASIVEMQDALKKEGMRYGADEAKLKTDIAAVCKSFAAMGKEDIHEILAAKEVEFPECAEEEPKSENARKSSKKSAVKLTKEQLSALATEYLCGVVQTMLNDLQEFLKTRRYLTSSDIASATAYLMRLRNGACEIDDIDHLGCRRIRTIGELLQNQCRLGLYRMVNAFRDKINGPETNSYAAAQNDKSDQPISKLLNPKPFAAQIRDFFWHNQLTQFMDQTNCLSEITNKRRLSALGPGGLTRERAGFEVRDVHPSHYGRICPIETPEGPNIGLISSLALYAKIDEFGFINTPYRMVQKAKRTVDGQTMETGKVTDKVEYLPADREESYVIAQANASQDEKGLFVNKSVLSRQKGDSGMFDAYKVNYIDVSPRQLISAAAGLIPFLEHDDANRALMGANMQRQAVPLLKPERPVVGTGLEDSVARFSRSTVIAVEDGIVALSTAEMIIVTKDGKLPKDQEACWTPGEGEKAKNIVPYSLLKAVRTGMKNGKECPKLAKCNLPAECEGSAEQCLPSECTECVECEGCTGTVWRVPGKFQRYNLYKFLRSNAGTLVNQHPIVKKGDKVKRGQAIADGSCTDQGELALGRNVTVAYMSWHGYNYEDAIIISQRLVSEDYYTSVHVSMESVTASDTKMGAEEITRDIPNVGEDALRNLDANGVIRIGAEVKTDDILVGKITPKSETDLIPEERLFKAIFGEKASDVKESPLKVPGGLSGVVMGRRIERKLDAEKSKTTQKDIQAKVRQAEAACKQQKDEVKDELIDTLLKKFKDKKFPVAIYREVDGEKEELVPADRKLTKGILNRVAQNFQNYIMDDCEEKQQLEEVMRSARNKIRDLEQRLKEEVDGIRSNENGEQGSIKNVEVYIASKRRLSIGDKMAGRHGNKGIVSKIVPVEDMPFMADGTPVDIILNPLGVPSRMNIGQVFETHVGWAAKTLGMTAATPVFDGISEENILKLLSDARAKKVEERGWTIDKDGHVRDKEGRNRDDDVIGMDGKTRLYDGQTGEPFVQKIVVGTTYMLKLDHLVANKIHARAVGTYSLVTQQPLGGKAQHGGQRFGEMEVWALEAYGAAYTLREMLTVKSDDTKGRTRIYDSIIKGDCTLRAGIPESFNVLICEMKSLCLDVNLRRGKLQQD